MRADPRRHDDVEPGIARRPRHRQGGASRIPILGHQKSSFARAPSPPGAGKGQRDSSRSGAEADGKRGNPRPGLFALRSCLMHRTRWCSRETAIPEGEGWRAILVTGAAGFIGRALCRMLAAHGHTSSAPCATAPARSTGPNRARSAPSRRKRIGHAPVDGVEIVVHLAQRAPPRGAAFDREPENRRRRLRPRRRRAGCRRLVYVSSIKAMGRYNSARPPVRAGDPARPQDELRPRQARHRSGIGGGLQRKTGIELAVIRPPLVYGPASAQIFAP